MEDPVTGLDYRRTTEEEQTSNGWKAATFLVEEGLSNASAGVDAVTFLVPLGDDLAVPITAEKVDERSGTTFTETRIDGGTQVYKPILHDYVFEGDTEAGSAFVDLTADSTGGYHAVATVGDVKADVGGSQAWWTLAQIPAADGEAPERENLSLVTLSPDLHRVATLAPISLTPLPDGPTAEPEPGLLLASNYKFGLFGEIKWCTRYESDWKSRIDTIGTEISNGFGNTDATLGQYHDHCWIADTLQDAQDCANNGGCADASGHDYTYNSDGDDSQAYRDDAWNDVDHSRLHYTFDGLHIAHVVHDGTMDHPVGTVCGLSEWPPGGASVAAGPDLPSGCRDYVSTHEVGHNFDATHDNALEGGCGTVMAESSQVSCRWNYFNEPGVTEVNDCTTQSDCPRSGTG
jgi:hypothetical protein